MLKRKGRLSILNMTANTDPKVAGGVVKHNLQKGWCPCCRKVNPDPAGRAKAVREATQTLARLSGAGWRIELWHNLVWCWGIRRGPLSLSSNRGSGYTTLFSFSTPGAGESRFLVRESFKDPNKAVRKQLLLVNRVVLEEQTAFHKFLDRWF